MSRAHAAVEESLGPLIALAPAKLNLCLFVGPRRADGLHEICSLFVPITLADQVTLEAGSGQDEVHCPGVRGPNLATRALSEFRARFGWRGSPVRVRIDKRIPVGGGLGGGSADAAAVLRLATSASGLAPEASELAGLAMSLGADVPSQLDPRPLLVTGAGEQLEPIDRAVRLAAVLLTVPGGLQTSRVYARADELGEGRESLGRIASHLRRAAGAAEGPLALGKLLRNDLQRAAIEMRPRAERALGLLREAGAGAALLSGSGPTAFGLFADPGDAERARAELSGAWEGECLLARDAPPGAGRPRPT